MRFLHWEGGGLERFTLAPWGNEVVGWFTIAASSELVDLLNVPH